MLPLITLLLSLSICIAGARTAEAQVTHRVGTGPGDDFDTVREAVDAADDGDVILIAPGTYTENLLIAGRSLTLQSASGDASDTVLEAAPVLVDDQGTPDPADDVFEPGNVVEVRAASGTLGTPAVHVVITGLTLANGNSGVLIRPNALVELLDAHVLNNDDGVELEGRRESDKALARAVVKRSLLEGNGDDGVDLDNRAELWIEDSTIRANANDGIEIRLQDSGFNEGESIRNVMLRNQFVHNLEDGLQLIDDQTLTPRSFRIERNVFASNVDAGIGMMCDQVSDENFEGCAIDEPVELVHNTFVANDHGLAGGASLLGVNNLFVGHTSLAVKNVTVESLLSHSGLHHNGADSENSNLVASVFGDPRLTAGHELSQGSAAVDAGATRFPATGEPILDVGPCDYRGLGPDLGAFELDTGPATIAAAGALDAALGADGDDALEKGGKVESGGKRLELGSRRGGVVALRFEGIGIERGAVVLSAELQLTAARKGRRPASLRIQGEASDDAAPLAEAPNDLSTRARTRAAVVWSPPPWAAKGAAGSDQRTPDLATVVQEIVSRPGWAPGNALTLFVSGTGRRSVAAREGGGDALLHVEFTRSAPACAP